VRRLHGRGCDETCCTQYASGWPQSQAYFPREHRMRQIPRLPASAYAAQNGAGAKGWHRGGARGRTVSVESTSRTARCAAPATSRRACARCAAPSRSISARNARSCSRTSRTAAASCRTRAHVRQRGHRAGRLIRARRASARRAHTEQRLVGRAPGLPARAGWEGVFEACLVGWHPTLRQDRGARLLGGGQLGGELRAGRAQQRVRHKQRRLQL